MSNLINRNEIRRLQKAARDNNKIAIFEWASQFENQIKQELEPQYENIYKEYLSTAIDNFMIAIAYTLVFSEEYKIDIDKVPKFLIDLLATVDMFRTGEYSPEDYKNQLADEGLILNKIKCQGILDEMEENINDKLSEN